MPTLARFLLRHALIGTGAAVAFVAILLALDIGRLGTLVARSEDGALAVAVLTAFFAITFGSAQVAFAMLFLGADPTDDGRVRPGSSGAHARRRSRNRPKRP